LRAFCIKHIQKATEMSTVKPYHEESGKREQVEQMFDKIAPKYDFLNHALSFYVDVWWRNRAISRLKDLNPQSILDVATGTGDLAITAAKKLNPKEIVGIDISNGMLDFGRKKLIDKGLDKMITFQTADSEALPFTADRFDAITVAFGVRNFENLEKGLSEMLRVLRPGGKAVVLEFSRPEIFPFKQIYNGYFKYLLPAFGRFSSNDPRAYTYLYESSQAFIQGTDFTDTLLKLGYKNPTCSRLTLGVVTIYTAEK
jgi:demethylmenaquinone methyltransferase / 2-methoxy-6-polyprenyl-1,4-benzoquinol methylase